MKPFSLLIKPASADCNLRCSYCFYLDKSALYPESKKHRMSFEVLEKIIFSYMTTEQPQYSFCWQGGEPALMGIDFFRRVIQLQEKYGKRGAVVTNSLQTNGTMIDDEFATFLSKYNFLVGISLDGHREAHDKYRISASGHGSHPAVLRTIEILKKRNVDFNILTLISSVNVNRAKQIYHYLCELDLFYHQYLPCVEFDSNGTPFHYTITGSEFGNFLCGIFNEWISKDVYRVSIRIFDSIIQLMLKGNPSICHMMNDCCQYFLVEYNGDVYPCDFFVESQRKLGNIMDVAWEKMLTKDEYLNFGSQKKLWNERCSQCEYLRYCAGDCLKYRLYKDNVPYTLSWLCEGWKKFYSYSLPFFRSISSSINIT